MIWQLPQVVPVALGRRLRVKGVSGKDPVVAPQKAFRIGAGGAWSWRTAFLAGLIAASPALALDEVQIRIPGDTAGLLEQVRASSLLVETRNEGRESSVDVLAAARSEYGRLIGLLYEHGYYSPVIRVRLDGREAMEVSTLNPPRQIQRAEIEIELGPQFTFALAEITPRAPGTTAPASFTTGQIARSTVVRDATAAALDGWRDEGHPLVEVADQQITARHGGPGGSQIDVSIRLAPGPQLRFGALVPQGNERTRNDRILRIAGLRPGEIYSPEEIARAESRLRRTGTFSSVALRHAETPNPDGTIDINALLDEAPLRRLGFGGEIDTVSGLGLTGFWLHRNLLGGAERLRLEAALSGIAAREGGLGYSFDMRYTRPATGNPDTDGELGLNLARVDERDYRSDAIRADVRLVRRLSERSTASVTLGLRYERSVYGTNNSLDSRFGTFYLAMGATRDSRNDTLNPSRGSFVTGEVMPYLGFAEADNGLRISLDARRYMGFGEGARFVLAGRFRLGAVIGPDLHRTPRDYLFYSGGGGSVRGLPYQSLGVEQGGVRSGGQGYAGASFEGRFRLTDSIGMAVFSDAGYVSEGVFSGASDLHVGAGIGVRYLTPIGPLRLDIATPVRRNAFAHDASSFQVYIGIGQAF